MKILFTSDWQADVENLDLCWAAHREILVYCKQYNVDTVVHCGDLKRAYNPLDGRMVNAVVQMIGEYKKNDILFLLDCGNHDRFGLYTDKENWLTILRQAGAIAFDEPNKISGSCSLFFLPFRQSAVLMRREAHDLAKLAQSRTVPKILVFHSDLKLARYNVRTSSEAEFTVDDLCPDNYDVCIGGHIHLPQRVSGNVHYVGSPFATDWGEANQVKRYLMFNVATRKLTSLRSKIPGMFDPTWPGFKEAKPKSWVGAKVRVHVQCDAASDVFSVTHKASLEAQKLYSGAQIVAVAELQEKDDAKIKFKVQDSDEQKVELYVKQTIDASLSEYSSWIVEYLSEQLKKTASAGRRTGKLEFIGARAVNFTSFKTLKFKYTPGLTVVSGQNDDRRGKSNGSGKSNFLSPAAVALFGATFKGQKHDHWMNRWTDNKEQSWVEVTLVNQSGGKGRIVRGRKPKFLRLWIDGKEVAAGNRPEQSQQAVESFIGFNWETLSNAIFVDQRRTNLMLTGTESERKMFLSRLQGLERFEKALVEIKEDLAGVQRRCAELSTLRQIQENRVIQLQEGYESLKKEIPNVSGVKLGLEKKVREWGIKKKKYIALRQSNETKKKLILEEQSKLSALLLQNERKRSEIKERMRSLTTKIDKLEGLGTGDCPMCEQAIDRAQRDTVVEHLRESLKEANVSLKSVNLKISGIEHGFPKVRDELNKVTEHDEEYRGYVINAKVETARMTEQITAAQMQEKRLADAAQAIWKAKARELEIEKLWSKRQQQIPVYEYCVAAFSRKGMPAFLNAQLCPVLNKAAAYYSQLFSEKEIQVVFNVNDSGESDVQVVNAHGGSEVGDQSQGEMRIASLIVSFALRHIAPQTNLLILDEPGEGLDPLAARTFAKGLKEIVSQFGSVFVVTHNPQILSELSDGNARRIVIVKKNRISYVKSFDD